MKRLMVAIGFIPGVVALVHPNFDDPSARRDRKNWSRYGNAGQTGESNRTAGSYSCTAGHPR